MAVVMAATAAAADTMPKKIIKHYGLGKSLILLGSFPKNKTAAVIAAAAATSHPEAKKQNETRWARKILHFHTQITVALAPQAPRPS